jgi:methylated-DNA-protein-cysteine methyltransferase related protein
MNRTDTFRINWQMITMEQNPPLSQRIKTIIKNIPAGQVATYGQIAVLAGNARATRAVFWILSSSSAKDDLPWHRVINAQGAISLKPGFGFEQQRTRLLMEGVQVDAQGQVDLEKYRYQPE